MRIGVIGSRGQLGADLCLNCSPSDKVVRLDRPDFEFDNPEHLTKIDDLSLDVLINSAAYNDVDKAEDEIDLAFRLNAQAPSRIAEYCQKKVSVLLLFQRTMFLVNLEKTFHNILSVKRTKRSPFPFMESPSGRANG